MSPARFSSTHDPDRSGAVDPGFARRYLVAVAAVMLVIGIVLVISADYSIGAMAIILSGAVAGMAWVAGHGPTRRG